MTDGRLRVVVTRPEPGQTRTADRLLRQGHLPVGLPLFDIIHLDFAPLDGPVDAALVTSMNAVHALAAGRFPVRGIVHCVGDKTARAVRATGWRTGHVAPDASRLADRLLDDGKPAKIFFYPCGTVHRPELEQRLAEAGHRVVVRPVYEAVPRDVELSLLAEPVDAVLFHAPSAAQRLCSLLEPHHVAMLSRARLLCLSDAVAASLIPALRPNAEIAKTPDEESLFALLEKDR